MDRSDTARPPYLDPEKVAYWYFRLNGFLQIENFVIHPDYGASQRTDADVLAVRFPHRKEFLFERKPPMEDDTHALGLSSELVDVLIAEVKTNDPCRLNGPWTDPDKQNVHRVVAAIGCVSHDNIDAAAEAIYETGSYAADGVRIRLAAVGRVRSTELAEKYPAVTQLVWEEMLSFIGHRFYVYRNEKRDVGQWDEVGRLLRDLAVQGLGEFIPQALRLMGVRSST